jgi:hypothetical protein
LAIAKSSLASNEVATQHNAAQRSQSDRRMVSSLGKAAARRSAAHRDFGTQVVTPVQHAEVLRRRGDK